MSKKILDGIKYWSQALMIPIYWLSFLTPRNRKIWIFGSTFGRNFSGNPKYLYLYSNQFKKNEVRPIWITHDKNIVKLLSEHGLEAYYYKSFQSIIYCLIAKVYIFDNYSKDISFWLSGGAIKVNLWHGSGNKKTNYDNKFDRVRHPRNNGERFQFALRRMSDEKPNHFTLATSEMMAKIFVSAFNTDREHILLEGYPRNDMLFDTKIKNVYSEIEKENLECMRKRKAEGNRLSVYMPTFRDSETKFFEVMDLEEFNEYLAKRSIVLFTKLHPKSKLKSEFAKVSYSNIINVDAEVDPYTFLREIDLLITDYSSIYSDYLMLNRPSVLFPFDFEEYSQDTRECYFEYEEYMPETKAYTMQELMDSIDKVLENDACSEGRLELRSRIFATVDGHSSKRLYEKVRTLI